MYRGAWFRVDGGEKETDFFSLPHRERDGRQIFQDMLTSGELDMTKPGRTPADVEDQQKQLDLMKTCVNTWTKRKSDAAKKVTNNNGGC
jgi:hypothetical protein